MTHEAQEHNELRQEGNFTGDRLTPIQTVFQEDVDEEVGLTVQQRLMKAGITEEQLSSLRSAIQPYMRPVHTKAELEELQKNALTPLVKMRTKIERICKKGREEANMIRNAWIAEEKTYTRMVKELEEPLNKYKEEFRAEQERIKREEEAEAERQLQVRYAALDSIGCVRRAAVGDTPERYVMGELSIPLDTINSADADTWDNLLRSARMIAEEVEAKKRYEEAKMLADAEALRQQEADIARRQKELEEREKKMRKSELIAVGCVEVGDNLCIVSVGDSVHSYFEQPVASLATMSQEEWDACLSGAKEKVAFVRQMEEEEEMREAVNEARKNELLALGCVEYVKNGFPFIGINGLWSLPPDNLHAFSDAEWESELLAAKLAVEERNLALKEAQEREAREALIADRVKRLKEAGWSHNPPSVCLELILPGFTQPQLCDPTCDDHDFEAAVAAGQAELARREVARQETLRQEAEAAARERLQQEQAAAAKAEEERVAKMGDAERWDSWVKFVIDSAPKMESEAYMARVRNVIEELDHMNSLSAPF
jgi:hypothetical protein